MKDENLMIGCQNIKQLIVYCSRVLYFPGF